MQKRTLWGSRAPLQTRTNSICSKSRLRRRSTNTPHCPNAPDERCQRGNASGMSLPCSTTSLALAIGDRSSVDGDIDHGLTHFRTGRKSRSRTGLPLSRDHRRGVDGGNLRSVRYRHPCTAPFCVLDIASARGHRTAQGRPELLAAFRTRLAMVHVASHSRHPQHVCKLMTSASVPMILPPHCGHAVGRATGFMNCVSGTVLPAPMACLSEHQHPPLIGLHFRIGGHGQLRRQAR